MRIVNQSANCDSAVWDLGPGEARHLPPAPMARSVTPVEGQLWITFTRHRLDRRPADGPAPDLPPAARDHWVGSGARLRVPAGGSVVIEARGHATFTVEELAPPPPIRSQPRAGRLAAWRRWLAPWLGADRRGWA